MNEIQEWPSQGGGMLRGALAYSGACFSGMRFIGAFLGDSGAVSESGFQNLAHSGLAQALIEVIPVPGRVSCNHH